MLCHSIRKLSHYFSSLNSASTSALEKSGKIVIFSEFFRKNCSSPPNPFPLSALKMVEKQLLLKPSRAETLTPSSLAHHLKTKRSCFQVVSVLDLFDKITILLEKCCLVESLMSETYLHTASGYKFCLFKLTTSIPVFNLQLFCPSHFFSSVKILYAAFNSEGNSEFFDNHILSPEDSPKKRRMHTYFTKDLRGLSPQQKNLN